MSHTNGHVRGDQRFRKGRPCPICGGSEDDRRGQGTRCIGFLSEDGQYAHCSREELAGQAPYHTGSQTYAHRLRGDCRCGTEHGPGEPSAEFRKRKRDWGRIVATYDYPDAEGRLVFQAVRRADPKGFAQRRPDGRGGWIWNLQGIDPVLFHLPALVAAPPDEPVLIPEGEKDVEALRSLGFVATCNPMGAGKWRDAYSRELRGRDVVVLPDNDKAGRDHAAAVARSVSPLARSVKVLEFPELAAAGADVSDWILMGGTAEGLRTRIAEAPTWTPPPEPVTGDDEDEPILDPWPELAPEALHGIAREIVEAVGDHTESDPVAILIQLLVAFGSLIDRRAHFVVGATHHYLNLFCVLVGVTSIGRKGSSLDVVRWILRALDPDWDANCVTTGLVSGEGLIHCVRDPTMKREAIKEGKRVVDYQEVETDQGVTDKRLLVLETELSRTLKAMNRETNTLSDVLRQCWDSGHLRTLGKNAPSKATGAHVSIIAHATKHDVSRHLTETDTANGFGNRFLWLAVRRSKKLPDGGRLSTVNFGPILRRLTRFAEVARNRGEMTRDDDAREAWHAVYDELSDGRPGLLGAILSRAEAQVMRIACLYALLDGEAVVRVAHLTAALALWKYCEDSARFVFGESLGNPDAERLLAALRSAPDGLSRSEISLKVFGNHKKGPEITKILTDMLGMGLIHKRNAPSTGGRPAQRWYAGREVRLC